MSKEINFDVSTTALLTSAALHRLFKKLEYENVPHNAVISRSKARGFWHVTINTTLGHAQYFNNVLEKAANND